MNQDLLVGNVENENIINSWRNIEKFPSEYSEYFVHIGDENDYITVLLYSTNNYEKMLNRYGEASQTNFLRTDIIYAIG